VHKSGIAWEDLALEQGCSSGTRWGDEVRYPLGRLRWPIERMLSWLKQIRRLRIRREHLGPLYEAFLLLRLLRDRLATSERRRSFAFRY